MRIGLGLGFVFLILTAGLARAGEPGKPRLFVLELRAESGVTASQARMLNEIMLSELNQTGRFDIFGEADIKNMLQVEQTKELLGCDDVACMAEIGGAIGADLTLVGSVGALGELFVLSLKVVNTAEVRVAGRWSDTVSGEPSVLVAKIKTGVRTLLAGIITAPTPPAPTGPAAASAAPPPPDAPASAVASPPAHVTPPPPEAEKEGTPIYESWWLWTAVGVVAAGGITAGIIAATQLGGSSGPEEQTANIRATATLPAP